MKRETNFSTPNQSQDVPSAQGNTINLKVADQGQNKSFLGRFKSKFNKQDTGHQEEGDSTKMVNFLDWTVKICVHLAVFLTPLFFLPVTASPIEFNKLVLLIVLIGIAGVAWMGRMVSENQLQVKRSFLSIPILIFTGAYILTSIFSVYRENSVWGYLGGESMSLAALLFFILLFFIISNNFNTRKAVHGLIINLLLSSSLVFIGSFLHIIGVNVFQFMGVEGKGFTTLGTIYSLAIYAGAILVFTMGLITEKIKGRLIRCASFIAAFLALTMITLVNHRIEWIVLASFMAILTIVGIMRNSHHKSKSFLLPTVLLIFCLFGFFAFAKKPLLPVTGLPVEVLPACLPSLQIGIEGIKERPLFGSGPGNFSYLYNEFKPPMGENSGLSFNQSTSYILTLFATGGVMTILSYFFLLFVMGRFAGANVYKTFFGKIDEAKQGEEDSEGGKIITPASLLWFYITIILFLANPSMTLMFVWWLAFGILDAMSSKGKVITISDKKSKMSVIAEKMGMDGREKEKNQEELSKMSLVISVLFVGIITVFIAVVYIMSQKYIASYYHQEALKKAAAQDPNLEEIGNEITSSIYYNQNRDVYYSALSDVYLLLAQKRINEKGVDLNDEDRAYIWGAVSQGIQAANSAIVVNKTNHNNYIKTASIYQSIIGLVEGAEQPALTNYEKARDLSPTDPSIYNQLGRIYLALYDLAIVKAAQENDNVLIEIPENAKEHLNNAKEQLTKSLEIYPQNMAARLMMATVLELQGDLDGAIALTEENFNFMRDNYNMALALSLLYYKAEKYEAAKNLLTAAISRWDNFSDAYYVLGLTYAQEGELDKSRQLFEKILESNQGNEDIKNILNDLNAGRTTFLKRGQDRIKVEEVQQKIEDEEIIGEEQDKNVVNNQEERQPEEE